MELITCRAVSKFCAAPRKITRDGTGAYLYKPSKSDLGQYSDGQRMGTVKKTVYHAGNYYKIKF